MKRFLIYATTSIFVCLLMFVGCTKGPDRDIKYILFVNHPSLDMIEGDEIQITASPTEQTFNWESLDTDVATVSSTGLVRAINDGVTIIIVTSSGGLSRTIPVNVVKFVP